MATTDTKVNYPEASAIAQAIKYQLRTGGFWDELTPAAKETFDQIATACARTVSGDGAHWDGIIGFAQAAKPSSTEPAQYKVPIAVYPPTAAQRAGIEAIERSMREIPQREGDR